MIMNTDTVISIGPKAVTKMLELRGIRNPKDEKGAGHTPIMKPSRVLAIIPYDLSPR